MSSWASKLELYERKRMLAPWSAALAAAVLLFAFAPESGCRHRDKTNSTVRLALGSQIEFMNLPITLAQQLGFFRDDDLNVAIAATGSGSKSLEALLGGSADVVVGSHDHAVQMAAQGRRIKSFVVIIRYPGSVAVLSPAGAKKIGRVEDLKGATVGVTSPGSSFHFFVNYLLLKHGLSPEDVSIVSLGGNMSRVAAIEHSKVDVGVLLEPGVSQLLGRSRQSKILADTRTLEGVQQVYDTGTYPSAVLYAKEDWLRDNPGSARRMAHVTQRALQWIQTHSPEQIMEKVPAEFQGGDPGLYLQALRHSVPTFSPDGIMTPEGAGAVKKVLSVSLAKVRSAKFDPATTYTNEFLSK